MQRTLRSFRDKQITIPVAALIVGAAVNTLMVVGNPPIILQDELIHASNAFFFPEEVYKTSASFHSLIFSSTFLCNQYFYVCGQLLNVLLLTIATSFATFAIPRHLIIQRALAAISLLFLPNSINASFYTPETLLTSTYLLTVVFATRAKGKSAIPWILMGATLGLATLTKPQAALVAIPLILFMVTYMIRSRQQKVHSLKTASAVILGLLLIRFSAFVSGLAALSIFGFHQQASETLIESIFIPGSISPSRGPLLENWLLPRLEVMAEQTPVFLLASSAGLLIPIALSMIIIYRNTDKRSLERHLAASLLVTLIILAAASLFAQAQDTLSGESFEGRSLLRHMESLMPPLIWLSIFVTQSSKVSLWSSRRLELIVFAWASLAILFLAQANHRTSLSDSVWLYVIQENYVASMVLIFIIGTYLFFSKGPATQKYQTALLSGLLSLTLASSMSAFSSARLPTGFDADIRTLSSLKSERNTPSSLLTYSRTRYWASWVLLQSGNLSIGFSVFATPDAVSEHIQKSIQSKFVFLGNPQKAYIFLR